MFIGAISISILYFSTKYTRKKIIKLLKKLKIRQLQFGQQLKNFQVVNLYFFQTIVLEGKDSFELIFTVVGPPPFDIGANELPIDYTTPNKVN